jgi:hypothetical protein
MATYAPDDGIVIPGNWDRRDCDLFSGVGLPRQPFGECDGMDGG